MEATATTRRGALGRVPAWVLGVLPLLAIAILIAVFAALGGPGLGERSGPAGRGADGRAHGAAPR